MAESNRSARTGAQGSGGDQRERPSPIWRPPITHDIHGCATYALLNAVGLSPTLRSTVRCALRPAVPFTDYAAAFAVFGLDTISRMRAIAAPGEL